MKKNYVWIVEMVRFQRARWEPTVGVALTKADAQTQRKQWAINSDDKFRVRLYTAVKP
jgi:hypothetical protein